MHAYVDGELDVVRSLEIETHLSGCMACARRKRVCAPCVKLSAMARYIMRRRLGSNGVYAPQCAMHAGLKVGGV